MVIDGREKFAKKMAVVLLSPTMTVNNGRTREEEVEHRTNHMSEEDHDIVLSVIQKHHGVAT